jgi:hypothetical protein
MVQLPDARDHVIVFEEPEPAVASLSREIAGRRLMCPCPRLPSSVSLSRANQWLSGPPNFNHHDQLGLSYITYTIFQSVRRQFTACSPGPPGNQVVFPSSQNGHLIQLCVCGPYLISEELCEPGFLV